MSAHNIPFSNIKEENHSKLSQICSNGIFSRTQERGRNNHGKRAISVRATEVLLYNGNCPSKNSAKGYVMPQQSLTVGLMPGWTQMLLDRCMGKQTKNKSLYHAMLEAYINDVIHVMVTRTSY